MKFELDDSSVEQIKERSDKAVTDFIADAIGFHLAQFDKTDFTRDLNENVPANQVNDDMKHITNVYDGESDATNDSSDGCGCGCGGAKKANTDDSEATTEVSGPTFIPDSSGGYTDSDLGEQADEHDENVGGDGSFRPDTA